MGNFLSMPSTTKLCESGSNRRLVFGLAEMQGWRRDMEDAHATVLDLDGPGESSSAFFAVYDGHVGSYASIYAGQNLHKRLVTEESYMEQDWKTALKKTFLGIDEDLRATNCGPSGCCAVAALLTKDNKLFVANAGDCRAVLSVKGKVKPLSFDHKPGDDAENARILAAGGHVTTEWVSGIYVTRVNGGLALSRALGDFEFKERTDLPPEAQLITADPEITCHEMTEEDEFLVMACDGIWECLSSQDVVDFVRYQVSEGKELTEICKMIFEHCLAPGTNGKGADNMSLLIVGITHDRTEEVWYEWIKERVRNEHGYKTSSIPPRLYDERSLQIFREQREDEKKRKAMGYEWGDERGV